MNQADSEYKCSKKVSYECILNNCNVDDISDDQNNVCVEFKQKSWSVCGKHSPNVGPVCNTEYVVGVAEIYSAKSQEQQQPGNNHPCQESLLRKVWGHLQCIITAHMNSCPRCNPKPPFRPELQSVSQSSVHSFLSPTALTPTLSCKESCLSGKSSCHKPRAPCLNARPSSIGNESASLSARSPTPIATSSFQKSRSSCSRALPPFSNVTPPCSLSETSSRATKPPNAKQSCPSPDTKVSTPKNNLICSNTKCPEVKPSYENKECPNSNPACGNAQCPNAKLPCHNSDWPNAKPFSPNPECPNAKPSCPIAEYHNAKALYKNAEFSNAKPSYSKCPNVKPPSFIYKPPRTNSEFPNKPLSLIDQPSSSMARASCPNAVPVCPNSKTKLYHSFSNDSLSSICKEDLVELTKAYLHKLTSSHKMRCPRCSKQTTFPSPIETITTYLRSMLEQAWSYFNTNTSSTKRICHPQCALSSSKITKKSSCTAKSRCCCSTPQPNCQKSESLDYLCFPKSDISPTRLLPAIGTKPTVICPRVDCPISFNPTSCPKNFEYEDTTLPTCKSEEQGTHEHKSCCTTCCKHASQDVQLSFIFSDTSIWPSINSPKPHQTVEELKASIAGTLDKSSGNLLGCEILDFRSTIKYSKPCVQDLNFPKDMTYTSEMSIPCKDLTLIKGPEDQGYDPHLKECKQSKQSLNNCDETMSPCIDPEEQNGKDEAGGRKGAT